MTITYMLITNLEGVTAAVPFTPTLHITVGFNTSGHGFPADISQKIFNVDEKLERDKGITCIDDVPVVLSIKKFFDLMTKAEKNGTPLVDLTKYSGIQPLLREVDKLTPKNQ